MSDCLSTVRAYRNYKNEIMKYFISLSFLFVALNSYGQKHNIEKITDSTTALYFDKSELRGFKYQSVTYYVDDDLQTVVVIKNGKIQWKKNVVLECEKSESSLSKIESLKLHKGSLHAAYGHRDIWILLDGDILSCGTQ